jgi:hypothetical protein
MPYTLRMVRSHLTPPRVQAAPFASVGAWLAAMQAGLAELAALLEDPALHWQSRALLARIGVATTPYGRLVCVDVEPLLALVDQMGLGPRLPRFRQLLEARRWQAHHPGRSIFGAV